MKKRFRHIIVMSAVMAAGGAAVRADVSSLHNASALSDRRTASPSRAAPRAASGAMAGLAATRDAGASFDSEGVLEASADASAYQFSGFQFAVHEVALPLKGLEAETGETAVRAMPALPGSTQLCLSAFAMLGAVQVLRNSRKIQFAWLPDWYHFGAPAQLGHVYSFDFNMPAVPVCRFAQPVAERPIFFLADHHETGGVAAQCSVVDLAAPRGPPVTS